MSKTNISQSAPDKGGAFAVTAADSLECISLGTCVPACEVKDMDTDFLSFLLAAQKLYGKKFKINSAFRSVAYEKKQGRNGLSSHCKGLAVDISCVNHVDRLRMLRVLLRVGFFRIGIAKTFIHVDYDRTKPASVWLYNPVNNGTF